MGPETETHEAAVTSTQTAPPAPGVTVTVVPDPTAGADHIDIVDIDALHAQIAAEQAKADAAIGGQMEAMNANASAQARNSALTGLLRDLQWSGGEGVTPTHRRERTCPDCRAFESLGHTEKCRIACVVERLADGVAKMAESAVWTKES